ncbi:extracellular solute-binding protein [Alcanivorax sp. 1008]|uniref:extracellular solute-binding protein n=1 Tax=Alcanivorax sp. 1008 TaxID=2816853 RepID=UPI001D1B0093|nr:extracellular solute-binding protein [Alcanivorax sp. 1008]MCC1496399.1 ABC transporter substrate-binding protein [Alcanivorax sp. 1008]
MLKSILLAPILFALATSAHASPGKHAIAMHGEPKYGVNFSHFDYVNANAPKGGTLRRHVIGTFDSFNPFIPQGNPAAGTGYLYDTLTTPSQDEPFTQYGLLAKTIELAADRSYVTYHLHPEARFADGVAVTSEDVVFSFNLLTDKGSPFYAYYYGDVERVEAIDNHSVRFHFRTRENKELPLIVGQMPVLPKHHWKDHDFSKPSLQVPIGSGPYEVESFQPGRRVVYQRRDNYWAKDLPVNRGQYNFDHVSFEYFLDETVSLEAFKGGAYDWRLERSAKDWASGYTSPALTRKEIILEEIPHSLPSGMQGFVMNQRRELFTDRTLREAIGLAMDFEWSNQNLFHGQYTRTRSFFQNSEMAATGLPSAAELELLEPFRKQLPKEVFDKEYQPPKTDGSGRPRENLQRAQHLLQTAGYTIEKNQLKTPNGTLVRFEILLDSGAFERVALPFSRNLKALGIDANVRRIDPTQYLERVRKFDYDMIIAVFPQSNSPGNEQRDFWHSSAADMSDSRNRIGLKNPAVDALVEQIIRAQSREQLVVACRALDRVLQWGHYVVPNWHVNRFRVAYRSTLARPQVNPPYGLPIDAWWQKP